MKASPAFASMMILFAVSTILFCAIHYISSDRDGLYEMQRKFVSLTGMGFPSISVSWHESRLKRLMRGRYMPYPELPRAERLDFVYGDIYGR